MPQSESPPEVSTEQAPHLVEFLNMKLPKLPNYSLACVGERTYMPLRTTSLYVGLGSHYFELRIDPAALKQLQKIQQKKRVYCSFILLVYSLEIEYMKGKKT